LKIWNFATAGAAVALAAFTGLSVVGCGGSSTKESLAAKFANAITTSSTTSTASTATTSTAAKAPAPKPTRTTSTPTKAPSTSSRAAAAAGAKEKLLQKLRASEFGAIALTSSAFKPGGSIDVRYTCDGASISPPLQWHGVPHGAAELFLLVADIGGGANSAVQWAVAMPASTDEIPAGSLPARAVVGVNSAGRVGWGGVCGTKGKLQHVTFLMYALNRKLGLRAGFDPSQVRAALKGGYVATGFTVASYQR
jgi:phosphatidylethanolamine-binding protein (PEBP) family uncharacterized protein